MKNVWYCCMLVIIAACTKSSKTATQNPGNETVPKYVTIKYYDNTSALLMQVRYRSVIDSIKDVDFAVEISDSVYNICSPNCILANRSILTIKTDPQTHLMGTVISRQIFSHKIDKNAPPPIDPITDYNPEQNNFRFDITAHTLSGDNVFYLPVKLNVYSDYLQQNSVGNYFFSDNVSVPPLRRHTFMPNEGGQSPSYYWSQPDSLYFEEWKGTSMFFKPYRFSDFYSLDIPWYTHQMIDRAFYARQSKSVCTQFILQNGNYASGIDFASGMERSVRYQYSADTTAIAAFVNLLCTGTDDFLWYYIADYRKSSGNGFYQFGEALEAKDFYDWVAVSYTDSVYVVNGNAKLFKQAATMKNTVEKDSKGRLVRITHRVSNSQYYKVMEITY